MIGSKRNSNQDNESQIVYVNPNLKDGKFNLSYKHNDAYAKVEEVITSIGGYLRSVSIVEDTLQGKQIKKLSISLEESNQPKLGGNGETCRQVYIINSTFTLQSFNLLNSLASALKENADQKLFLKVVITAKKEKDESTGKYNKFSMKNGEKVYLYQLYVVNEGEDKDQYQRYYFGETDAYVGFNDTFNEAHTKSQNLAREAESKAPREKFWVNYVNSVMRHQAFACFNALLAEQGKKAVLQDENEFRYQIVDLNPQASPSHSVSAAANVPASDDEDYDGDDDDYTSDPGTDSDLPF